MPDQTEEFLQCPLKTAYATSDAYKTVERPFAAIAGDLLEKLYVIRQWPIDAANNPIPFKMPASVREFHFDPFERKLTDEKLVIKEFQKQAIAHLARMPRFILGEAVGLGKTLDALAAFAWLKERNPDAKMVVITTKSTAQPLDAKISTPQGWKLMGDMQVGDVVNDPDGGMAQVDGVYPKGRKRVYKVTTEDGGNTEVCEDHLWLVQTLHSRRSNEFVIRDTKTMVAQGTKRGRSYRFRLPLPQPVEFNQTESLPIDSYVMGVLLGDGSLRHGAIFYNQDPELVDNVRSRIPTTHTVSRWSEGHWAIVANENKYQPNVVFSAVKTLKVNVFSYEKFIPDAYKTSSILQRIELLRGLMDTDGSCSRAGQSVFVTTSPRLRDDVIHLVRSLGGLAFWSQTYLPDGKSKHETYVVTVRTQFNPFLVSRKASRWHKPRTGRAIIGVEYVGLKAVQCLRVSSGRNIYLTDDFIVTHNTYQWADECEKYTTLRARVMTDTYKGLKTSDARYSQMIDFLEGGDYDILIAKYDSLKGRRKIDPETKKKEKESEETRVFKEIIKKHRGNIVLTLDECHRLKKPGTEARRFVMAVCRYPERVWALTATAIKNGLDEFYSIALAIGVAPLGSMQEFYGEYCLWREAPIGNGRTISLITGFKNVAYFKEQLRPFFLGRSQKQVNEKLPALTTIYHPIELDEKQAKLLVEIPMGLVELPPILFKVEGEWYAKERDHDNEMTQLSIQQLLVNHWALLDRNNPDTYLTTKLSPKEDALLDMLDGEYRGEKVIVYTKYKTWIDRLEWLTDNGHFTGRKFLRVTGDENEKQRRDSMRLFQSPNSGYDLIVVNAAGMEGVNLQQAAHMVLLDCPWAWGDLIQLVGRMVRMASPHSACTLHIFIAKGTIDEYTMETLKGKKGVFEAVLGQSHSVGILDDGKTLDLTSGMEAVGSEEEFRTLLKAYAKQHGMKTYLKGDQIKRNPRGHKKGNEQSSVQFG